MNDEISFSIENDFNEADYEALLTEAPEQPVAEDAFEPMATPSEQDLTDEAIIADRDDYVDLEQDQQLL